MADRYEALNLYLTLENGAQPMLEPFRLPTDFLSLVTGQTITNPFADAVEPAIAMLGNLGYTNVTQYGADPNDFRDDYQRDFSGNFGSNGGEAMPFFSYPQNIDWEKVPADFARALSGGIQDAFFYGGIPRSEQSAAVVPEQSPRTRGGFDRTTRRANELEQPYRFGAPE